MLLQHRPLLRFHRTNSDERVLRPRNSLWFLLATDLTFKNYCMQAPRRHYISSFNRKCKFVQVSRRSAGSPLAWGPIVSNRSNRLRAGVGITV